MGMCTTEPDNSQLVIIDSCSFISYMSASQQVNCSTREPLKAPYGKQQTINLNLISHFQYFTNVAICELLKKLDLKWLSYRVQVLVTNGEYEVENMINY